MLNDTPTLNSIHYQILLNFIDKAKLFTHFNHTNIHKSPSKSTSHFQESSTRRVERSTITPFNSHRITFYDRENAVLSKTSCIFHNIKPTLNIARIRRDSSRSKSFDRVSRSRGSALPVQIQGWTRMEIQFRNYTKDRKGVVDLCFQNIFRFWTVEIVKNVVLLLRSLRFSCILMRHNCKTGIHLFSYVFFYISELGKRN